MPRYVAFLRAVNVGRASTVKMDALRRVFEGLGFSNVSTFIASGNVIFETRARNTDLLEQRIEQGVMEVLGKDLTPFVRSMPELQQIVAFEAFPASVLAVGDRLGVVFLSAPPGSPAAKMLESSNPGAEEFRVRGREIHWLRRANPEGGVPSALLLDQVLTEPFTIRSMGTLKKLTHKYVLHSPSESPS